MGSTQQSTTLTPSTFAGRFTGMGIAMQAVTSSGAYFSVADASKFMILVANASSSDTGAVYVEPGAKWAGAQGMTVSTTVTAYSTATAPIAVSVPLHGITGSSAIGSTTLSFVAIGPLDASICKSSDEKVYIAASTGSTKMFCAVLNFDQNSN